MARFQSKVSDGDAPIGQDIGLVLIAYRPTSFSEQPVDVFSGFSFGGGHFGLAILFRPSHESLLLRGGRAEWGYQKLRGLRRSGEPFKLQIGGILRDMAGNLQVTWLCGGEKTCSWWPIVIGKPP